MTVSTTWDWNPHQHYYAVEILSQSRNKSVSVSSNCSAATIVSGWSACTCSTGDSAFSSVGVTNTALRVPPAAATAAIAVVASPTRRSSNDAAAGAARAHAPVFTTPPALTAVPTLTTAAWPGTALARVREAGADDAAAEAATSIMARRYPYARWAGSGSRPRTPALADDDEDVFRLEKHDTKEEKKKTKRKSRASILYARASRALRLSKAPSVQSEVENGNVKDNEANDYHD